MSDPQTPAEKPRRGRPGLTAEDAAKGRAIKDKNRADRIARGERPTPIRAGTKAGVSRDIRVQVLTALNFVGGVKYLARQAEKNPGAFMALIGKCLQQEDGSGDKTVNYIVQQLVVSALPVSGVLSSPIAEHVMPAPLRLVGNGELASVVIESGDG